MTRPRVNRRCGDCGAVLANAGQRGKCCACFAAARSGGISQARAADGSARLLAAMQGYFARHHGVGR